MYINIGLWKWATEQNRALFQLKYMVQLNLGVQLIIKDLVGTRCQNGLKEPCECHRSTSMIHLPLGLSWNQFQINPVSLPQQHRNITAIWTGHEFGLRTERNRSGLVNFIDDGTSEFISGMALPLSIWLYPQYAWNVVLIVHGMLGFCQSFMTTWLFKQMLVESDQAFAPLGILSISVSFYYGFSPPNPIHLAQEQPWATVVTQMNFTDRDTNDIWWFTGLQTTKVTLLIIHLSLLPKTTF